MSMSISMYLICLLKKFIRQNIPSKDNDGREGSSGNEAREGEEKGLEKHGAVDVVRDDFGQVRGKEEKGLFLPCKYVCVCVLVKARRGIVEGVGKGVCVCI